MSRRGALVVGLPRVLLAGECARAVRATGQSDVVEMHGKCQRSSRERLLAVVLVGRPRLTALNAGFAPEVVAYGLRAVRVSRPWRPLTMGLSGFSGGGRCRVCGAGVLRGPDAYPVAL
jgi:hypothetical protein